MSTILSSGTRSNLRALQEISSLMLLSQKRLATGKRVNSPTDNPINFFTAASLNARAAQLNTLVDSSANAIKTVETASIAIASIEDLVATAQTIATQALQSTGSNAKVTGTVTGLTGSSSIAFSSGTDTITVGDGVTTATYMDATPTVQEFLDTVNSTSGLLVKASLTSDGRIELEALSTNSIIIGGTSSAGEKASIGLVAGTTTGTLNATRQGLAAQFDQIRAQIDQLARDAGYNGVNLLNGNNLSVAFNETGTANLTVTGVSYNSTSLGIPVASTGTGYQFQSNTEINAALTALTGTLKTLSTQSTLLESNLSIVTGRQEFNAAMADLLETGADDLVLADVNEESANLLALKTRRDLAVTALSLTAESDRSVLKLFGI